MEDQVVSEISTRLHIQVGVIRIESIDILRASTMVLMIFVNDLGSLRNIPDWLEHVKPGVDGIGLADTVFPAFLFIVGMSLPYAIDNRRAKGDSQAQLIRHVISRSIALLLMGVFLVNGETISKSACGLDYTTWSALSCLAFILIWNVYSKSADKIRVLLFKSAGIVILLLLAYIYRGFEDGKVMRFGTQWWGILGLIGWSYLVTGIITVLSKNRFLVIAGSWAFFALLSILYALHITGDNSFTHLIPEPIIGGTLVALSLGGVMLALSFKHFTALRQHSLMILLFATAAVLLLFLGWFTHKYFIIAKLGATPPWLFICSALTLITFMIIHWVADIKGNSGWFRFIKPAGTDTLLCYLIPYFLIFLMHTTHFKFPEPILVGTIGLVKSLCFALLCVGITYALNKSGIKLKL